MISKLLPFALLSAQTMAMGKRGLTYEDAAVANLFNDSSEVSWGYNWGFTSKGLDPYLEFTPMLWGLPSGPEPEWMEVLQSNATEHALGFNEPDLGSQANITAAAAAEGHHMGIGWMEQFLEECSDCTFDFAAIHWYSNNDPEGFKKHVSMCHESTGLPIWVTEFAADGEEEEQISFLENVLGWLDEQDYVERYAYFGVFPGFLVNESGDGLSDLGKVYAA